MKAFALKRKKCILLCAAMVLSVLFALALLAPTSFAAETNAGFRLVDGVEYDLSEDGSHYIAIGAGEHIPKLVIKPVIDGLPVTEVAESAFHNNTALNEISIPSSVTKIGKCAFRNCKNLIKVTLPKELTEIPEEAFRDCRMLSSITLPESLVSIGDRAFYNATMLGTLNIPASVNEIGYDTFFGCESILFKTNGNKYAEQYASENNINTDFTNTTTFFAIVIFGALAVSALIIALLAVLFRKYRKKHPNFDPTNGIDRFFTRIGRFFAFIFSPLRRLYEFLKPKVSAFLNEYSKKRQAKKAEKRRKKLEEKQNKLSNESTRK